jgi:hypothetical protein
MHEGSGGLSDKLEQIVGTYFAELRDKHGLGAGTPELSYYPAVAKLLEAIGQQLKPKVLCLSAVINLKSAKALGLDVPWQVQQLADEVIE